MLSDKGVCGEASANVEGLRATTGLSRSESGASREHDGVGIGFIDHTTNELPRVQKAGGGALRSAVALPAGSDVPSLSRLSARSHPMTTDTRRCEGSQRTGANNLYADVFRPPYLD
jgi:hypothetical protein